MNRSTTAATMPAAIAAVKSTTKPAPCRCDEYAFPHRRSSRCDQRDIEREIEREEWEQHKRDLQSWAASSRG